MYAGLTVLVNRHRENLKISQNVKVSQTTDVRKSYKQGGNQTKQTKLILIL